MKATQSNLSLSVLTLAVRGALAAMAVMPLSAMADSVADQVSPTNSIEIGVIGTTQASAKFGEYNGLDRQGAEALVNISLKGGDAYGQGAGTTRWSVIGTDLGSTSRELGMSISDQGKWSMGIDYDGLRHNIENNYLTPYQGTLGGNTFLLPESFGVVSLLKPTQTPTPLYGAQALTPSQLAAFHNENVDSKRDTTSFKGGFNFSQQLGLSFDYKHIDQTGAKLMAVGSDALDQSASGGFKWGGEQVAILMNPTMSQTDNFTLALNWKGDNGFASVGYYGSLYHDQYNGLNFSNPYVSAGPGLTNGSGYTANNGTDPGNAFPLDSMQTNPSNQFHQLNMNGGFNFSPATKLTGGMSYARNTQNVSYAGTYTPGTMPILPVSSLDATVDIKHIDLKLAQRTSDALNLAAAYTYNERNSKTASNAYQFLNLGGEAADVTNIPESWRHNQFDLSADYRIDSKQHLHAGYGYDEYKRWCNNALANSARGVTPADGGTYPASSSCVQVPKETTNSLALNYMLNASDAVRVKAGYRYSDRNSDVNSTFYSPLQSNGEGYENVGIIAFFQASRKENQANLGIDWQANDRLSFDLSGKYAKDDYDATLGVQQGEMYSANLDANFAYSETNSVNAYVTTQRRTRDMYNGNGRLGTTVATKWWTNNLTDDATTAGIGAKQKGLMGGKLVLAEDLTYSLDKTDYSTGIVGTACTVTSSTCGAFPTLKSEMTQVKITGDYALNKTSAVMVGYLYQHLHISDPTYYSQFTNVLVSGTGKLLDGQVAPSYNVSSVYIAYKYSFK